MVTGGKRARLVRPLGILLSLLLACVEGPTGPGSQVPAQVRVEVRLPLATPPAWLPAGDTLRVLVRRAGRAAPILETAAATDSLVAHVIVPLEQAVERFVATAELLYGGQLLFLAFDAVQLRAGLDTAVTLDAVYVGPGAAATVLTVVAADSTLEAGDTTRVVPTARDSAGQALGHVPVRFVNGRPDLFVVDTAGLVTALDVTPDSALVDAVMPTGLTASVPLRVVQALFTATVVIGGDVTTPILVGDTRQLSASALDQTGAPITPADPYVWTALDPAIATVDASGLVAGVSAGSGRIRLASGAATPDTATVTVGAVPLGPIRTWVGGHPAAPTDWSTAANWNPAGVPGGGDTAIVAAAASQPVLTAAVTVGGVRITGGNLTLNGHALTAIGDFGTENGLGTLTMQQAGDVLAVGGRARFQGAATNGLLTDGVLRVAGAFEQRNAGAGLETFQASGDHRVILNGATAQQLIAEGSPTFGHLEIANTSGGVSAPLATTLEVEGDFTISTATTFDAGTGALDVEGTVFTVSGSTLSTPDLRVFGAVNVGGAFAVARVDFAGVNQIVPDSLTYQSVLVSGEARLMGPTAVGDTLRVDRDTDADLTVGGHTLTVATLDVGGFDGQGTFTMQDPLDVVIVTADATFRGGSTAGRLTDGNLYVAGDFLQSVSDAFAASDNHRLLLDGTGPQEMVFLVSSAVLHHLEIANTAGGVALTTTEETVELTLSGELRISSPAALTGVAAVLDVVDSVVTDPGSTLMLEALLMRGGLDIRGALQVGTAGFAGTGQDVPAQGVFQNVNVSGTARLVAPMTFAGFVLVRGVQADLTLNGQRLDAGAFTTGGAGFPTGTLTMTDPADSLVVATDASFSGASTAGRLSAGTLVVGGGLFQAEDPSSFQPSGTHRTVLNGAAQQVVSFSAPGLSAATSHFHDLELAKPGSDAFLQSDAAVAGELHVDPAQPQRLMGVGRLVTADGVNVAGLTLDGVALAVGAGTISRFDDVTFLNQDPAVAQLTITHPGAVTPFGFTDIEFLTGPSTGSYVSATDLAPGDGNVLTINLSNTVPADGSAFTLTSGGAVVTWPGGAPAPGTFAPTGSMHASHTGGAAVVLNDGTVLVVGGLSTGGDRYDPVAGVFTATPGSMTLFREGLTASKLVNGKVLVTGGGQIFPATTRTAELFDPGPGTFALTDSLGDAVPAAARGRRYHTAAVLASGLVLVTGGEGVTATSQLYRLATAETYDQATEAFTVGTSPARARSRHAAALLSNGRVLVAGGRTNFNDFGDQHAELFDPATGNWSATGTLNTGRNGHTATVLANGLVLVTGGSDVRDDANRRLATAELYDPATGAFTPTGSMSVRRQYHFAVLLPNGKVLVGGGRDENNLFPLTAELYDPVTGTFSTTGGMLFGDERMVAILLPDGRVLVTASTVAQVYTP